MDCKNYKICIATLTKNSAKWIPKVLTNITTISKHFNDYEVLILDGYSTDFTKVICDSWCKTDPEKRKFLKQPTANLERGKSLKEARNFVIDYFRPQFSENVLLLLIDSDSPGCVHNDAAFLTNFERDDWAAVFANQPSEYYDVWALRDQNCPIDWQIEWRITGDINCVKKYQVAKSPDQGWWPVKSAFGGAGMYRTHLIPSDVTYECLQQWPAPNGEKYIIPVCEHVPFHENIVRDGGKLYINCRWLIGDHE
jgi:glycosyltransferase involved in cell wall biosynthesis